MSIYPTSTKPRRALESPATGDLVLGYGLKRITVLRAKPSTFEAVPNTKILVVFQNNFSKMWPKPKNRA
jgi:hypothetical protein